MNEIWISYYSNITGEATHIPAIGWDDVKSKTVKIIENEIINCSTKVAAEILVQLDTSLKKGVKLFNESNFRRNNIRFYSKSPYKEL